MMAAYVETLRVWSRALNLAVKSTFPKEGCHVSRRPECLEL